LEIDINKLIQKVTSQVISELRAQGVRINYTGQVPEQFGSLRIKSEKINMDKYRSPVLTENHLRRLHELTGEIIIPRGTVITPRAREIVKEKKIIITYNTK
jgi:hypothetical protein